MITATSIVDNLLEADDPDDVNFLMGYVEQADKPWTRLRLIAPKAWRAFFRSMGYKASSLYFNRNPGKQLKRFKTYRYMTGVLQPIDGHVLDWQDEALLREYTYAFLEKSTGQERRDLGYVVDMSTWSESSDYSKEHYPGKNEIWLDIMSSDGTDSYERFYPIWR